MHINSKLILQEKKSNARVRIRQEQNQQAITKLRKQNVYAQLQEQYNNLKNKLPESLMQISQMIMDQQQLLSYISQDIKRFIGFLGNQNFMNWKYTSFIVCEILNKQIGDCQLVVRQSSELLIKSAIYFFIQKTSHFTTIQSTLYHFLCLITLDQVSDNTIYLVSKYLRMEIEDQEQQFSEQYLNKMNKVVSILDKLAQCNESNRHQILKFIECLFTDHTIFKRLLHAAMLIEDQNYIDSTLNIFINYTYVTTKPQRIIIIDRILLISFIRNILIQSNCKRLKNKAAELMQNLIISCTQVYHQSFLEFGLIGFTQRYLSENIIDLQNQSILHAYCVFVLHTENKVYQIVLRLEQNEVLIVLGNLLNSQLPSIESQIYILKVFWFVIKIITLHKISIEWLRIMKPKFEEYSQHSNTILSEISQEILKSDYWT